MTGALLLFVGTTEGRELADYVRRNGLSAEVAVSGEYGREMLGAAGGLRISDGPADGKAAEEKMRSGSFDMVLDATHPSAGEFSAEIRAAAERAGLPYIRVCRRESDSSEGIRVSTVEEAVEFLSHTKGTILAATGSKGLPGYRKLADYRTRVYACILPDAQTILDCTEMGFERRNLICMQGPFSRELNEALLRQIGAKWMVAKEAGREGGFAEIALAARQAGVQLVIVGRASREEGYSLQQTCAYLKKYYRLSSGRQISLAGVGMGSEGMMTGEVKEAIVRADLCIGSERMLDCARGYSCRLHKCAGAQEARDYLEAHPEYERVCVLLSGDAGFGKEAQQYGEALRFPEASLRVLPGISTLSCLCARLGVSADDVRTVRLHERTANLVYEVDTHEKVFVLLNGQESVQALCQELMEFGLNHVRVAVGECLSYKKERIRVGTPEELVKNPYERLCAALIENPSPVKRCAAGIPKEEWVHWEEEMLPPEVRAAVLAGLRLRTDSVVYGIGAGAAAVEAARQAWEGRVYAVEGRADAVERIRMNRRHFRTANLVPVYGEALQVCRRLEMPTHVFIEGEQGNLRELVSELLQKNPGVRIVVCGEALETLEAMLACFRELPLVKEEIVQIQTAREADRESGRRLEGGAPVFLICCRGRG